MKSILILVALVFVLTGCAGVGSIGTLQGSSNARIKAIQTGGSFGCVCEFFQGSSGFLGGSERACYCSNEAAATALLPVLTR